MSTDRSGTYRFWVHLSCFTSTCVGRHSTVHENTETGCKYMKLPFQPQHCLPATLLSLWAPEETNSRARLVLQGCCQFVGDVFLDDQVPRSAGLKWFKSRTCMRRSMWTRLCCRWASDHSTRHFLFATEPGWARENCERFRVSGFSDTRSRWAGRRTRSSPQRL